MNLKLSITYIANIDNMLFFIKAFFGICFLLVLFCIGIIILGEYLADTFKGSKFDKWWKNNVITQIPEDYED